jgi:hypothetical protein
MRKTIFIGITILLFTTLLSGCFWPRNEGQRGGEERHGEHHDEHR